MLRSVTPHNGDYVKWRINDINELSIVTICRQRKGQRPRGRIIEFPVYQCVTDTLILAALIEPGRVLPNQGWPEKWHGACIRGCVWVIRIATTRAR